MINVMMKGCENIGLPATISIHSGLIMLHSPNISAQWPIDGVGVQLTHQGQGVCKLAFMFQAKMHQGFYFCASNFNEIDHFFKDLGFPMPKPINDNWIKENA